MNANIGTRRPPRRRTPPILSIAVATTLVTLLLMQVPVYDFYPGGGYVTPEWALALHLGTVLPAVPLGAYLLWRKKGGALHRRLGGVWFGMVTITAVVTFWMRGAGGGFSGIHLFSLATLIALAISFWRIRAKDVHSHQIIMISLYIGLIIAGGFALAPGRAVGDFLSGLLAV